MRWREVDAAWMAGLFEGEGCIYFRGKGGVSLSLHMTDEDVVRRFHSLAGFGAVHFVPKEPPCQDVFAWHIGQAEDVERLLQAFLPFLGARRRSKAEEALTRLASIKRVARPNSQPCGTHAAYYRHRRNGEEACTACKRAVAVRNAEYLKRKAAS